MITTKLLCNFSFVGFIRRLKMHPLNISFRYRSAAILSYLKVILNKFLLYLLLSDVDQRNKQVGGWRGKKTHKGVLLSLYCLCQWWGLSTDRDFYCLNHATSWCLNCLSTDDPMLAMAGRVFLPLTLPCWDSNVDYIFLVKTGTYTAFLKTWLTAWFA